MAKITKTEKYLLLIQTICKAPKLTLSEKKVIELFGNPSRATFFRDIAELCTDQGIRKAILQKIKDNEGNVSYQLNQCDDWYSYLEGSLEIQYVLKVYKELGHLFPNLEMEGIKANTKELDRKFIYHTTTKSKESAGSSLILESIIRSLVGSRKLLIDYKEKTVDIYPLTLCQHRDELYLLAYKNEIKESNLRTYKVSRIFKLVETNNRFRYPNKHNWDPKVYFKNSSGLIVNQIEKAVFKVFGHSRKIIAEKNFLGSQLIKADKNFDQYECEYTNIEEFAGTLFIYGQDIEILGSEKLREFFVNKAKEIISRNNKPDIAA